MAHPLPGRRTVLLAGLAGLAGCSIGPRPSRPVPTASGGPTSPAPSSEPPPASSTSPTGPWRVRVMTYNMLTSTRTAIDFNPAIPLRDVELAQRAPVMAGWITTAGADIIGLQENEANSPAELPIRALAPLLPGFGQLHPELEVPIIFGSRPFAAARPTPCC